VISYVKTVEDITMFLCEKFEWLTQPHVIGFFVPLKIRVSVVLP